MTMNDNISVTMDIFFYSVIILLGFSRNTYIQQTLAPACFFFSRDFLFIGVKLSFIAVMRYSQSRAEACTPYTEYRDPGLRGAREGPLYSVNFFFKSQEKSGKKKKEKSIIPKKQKMFYICLYPLENFRA